MGQQYYKWSTADEIRFIDGLGTGSWARNGRMKDRRKLLQNYMATLKDRKQWGDIIAMSVIEHVENALKGA